MATTARGWPLPDQTTAPPDVVGWLAQGLNAADADLTGTDADVVLVNQRLLYGPVASLPATLLPGQIYFGW